MSVARKSNLLCMLGDLLQDRKLELYTQAWEGMFDAFLRHVDFSEQDQTPQAYFNVRFFPFFVQSPTRPPPERLDRLREPSLRLLNLPNRFPFSRPLSPSIRSSLAPGSSSAVPTSSARTGRTPFDASDESSPSRKTTLRAGPTSQAAIFAWETLVDL